jgi:hypothetical protein
MSGKPLRVPTWIDTLLFLAVMSGPPAIRDRDMYASLAGEVDAAVLVKLVIWACAGLWVVGRLAPSLLRYGRIPAVNRAQTLGVLLVASLTLSLWGSPGFLLTAFTLLQFVIMIAFAWVFTERYGYSIYLRYLFVGVCLLTVVLLIAAWVAPTMVIDELNQRFRGERIAPTGAVAGMGLIFCLSNLPRLKSTWFVGAVGLFGVLLAISRMRTAYVGMLAYLMIGYLFGAGLRVRRLVPVLVAGSLAVIVLGTYTSAADYLVRDPKSIQDMSDRIPLWEHLTTTVMSKQPLIGLGFYAASRVLAPEHNPRLGNAHSAFFEFLVGGGILGAVLYVALCAVLLSYAVRLLTMARGQPEAVATGGLFVFALLLGLTATDAVLAGPVGFTFWSMTAILPMMCRDAVARDARANAAMLHRRVHPVVRERSPLLRS